MKLTVEFSATELQKMLQAIAGSQEHQIKDQKSVLKSLALVLAETKQKYDSSK